MQDPSALRHVEILLAEPGGLNRVVYDLFYGTVDESERHRVDSLAVDSGKCEYLVAHILLRVALSRLHPIAPSEWQFAQTHQGRPLVRAPLDATGLHFSISHTRGLVACVTSQHVEVGVDVEEMAPCAELGELTHSCLSDYELAQWRRLGASQQPYRFYQLWTLKESLLKAMGSGLGLPLASLSFRLGPEAPPELMSAPNGTDAVGNWSFRTSRPTPKHIAALAVNITPGGPLDVRWRRLRIQDLVEFVKGAASSALKPISRGDEASHPHSDRPAQTQDGNIGVLADSSYTNGDVGNCQETQPVGHRSVEPTIVPGESSRRDPRKGSSWLLPEYLQRLWFIDSVAKEKSLLNIGADIRIQGRFEPQELRSSFAAAIARHDAFRLQFLLGCRGPECRVLAAPTVRWRQTDLTSAQDIPAEDVYRIVAEHEREPFRLEDGSAIRGSLYLLADDRTILAVTAHHLIADAWTLRVLLEDVMSEWGRLRGEDTPDIEQPGSFLDYIDLLPADSSHAPAERASRDCLMRLPLDRPVRPEERSGAGGEVVVRLSPSSLQELRQVCAANGTTRFVGLTTALGAYLAWLSHMECVELGILVTSRNIRTERRTAGCFVQAVPLLVDLSPEIAVSDAMGDLSTRLKQTYPGESAEPHPLAGTRFPVMVSMVRDSAARLRAPEGISVKHERRRHTQAECDLHVFFYERPEGLEVVFNYDADVLSSGTVSTWASRYLALLERICAAPRISLREALDLPEARAQPTVEAFDSGLNHIGIAAWELDIGLRRLSSVGIPLQRQPWADPETGVAMALTGPLGGIQFEVVAPLREDAPCVGALMRDGEGPYHCCWHVSDTSGMVEAMKRCGIEHTIIQRDGRSGLFPSERITFIVVTGLGLVEFLDGAQAHEADTERSSAEVPLSLSIQSDDLLNARRFLRLAGYGQSAPASHDSEAWGMPDSRHTIRLAQAKQGEPSRLVWVGTCPPRRCTAFELWSAEANGTQDMATLWWSRIRLHAGEKVTVEEKQSHGW